MIDKELQKGEKTFPLLLEKYIEENDYSKWTSEALLEAETRWTSFPEDSEEYRKLILLRKQRERKLSDEKKYREFFMRSYEQKVKELELKNKYDDLLWYLNDKQEREFEKAIQKPYKSFLDTFEEFKKEKKIESDYEVCKRANLTRDVLSKLKNTSKSVANRDILWALAIALGLNIKETEQLFESCGLSMHGGFKFSEYDMRRERALEFFVAHNMGIDEVNEVLKEKNLLPVLGNNTNIKPSRD